MSKRKTYFVMALVVIGLATSSWLLAIQPSNSASKETRKVISPSSNSEKPTAIAQQLKEDVEQLAAESRYSTTQYRRAADYVIAQAEAVGLPVKEERVKGISRWKRGENDRCEILGASRQVFPLTALANSKGGDFEGEVVQVNNFVDKNQGPPPQRFDEGGKKRIVYFPRPLRRDRSIKGYVDAVVQRNHGASWAARYGAAAVIVRSVQTGDGPPHGGAVTYAADAPKIPAAVLSVAHADSLERLLRTGKVSAHFTVTTTEADREQSNVVIRIPGTSRTDEIVLLSAHLDSHDTTPGAADDAVGVASVLAVMREFARNRPARTVLIVFFADEEIDFLGGRAFAEAHQEDLGKIISATEMDDGDGPPYALQITSTKTGAKDAELSLREIAKAAGREASHLEIKSDPETYGSDLELLWTKHKIPEVAILQDLSRYFDKHHAKNDTPENVDWDGLQRSTSLLLKVMQAIASGAVTPKHGASMPG